MIRRRGLGGIIATVVVFLVVAAASANAAGTDPGGTSVTYFNGKLYILNDKEVYGSGVSNVALVDLMPPGSSEPDLVLGDLGAGIADPIPSLCFRVDPNIIRCPQSMVTQIYINLGPGNDAVSAAGIDRSLAPNLGPIKIVLGQGNDEAVGGPVPNLLFGGPGRDRIMGGPLGDKLFGGGQSDFLVGQQGNDLFQCGKGPHDLFNDGPGKDLVNVKTCERRVHREFGP